MGPKRPELQGVSPAPGGGHTVGFAFKAEVQMGVWYFYCCLDGRAIKERDFGDVCVWSEDGRFFAVQEWLSTNRSQGPDTQVLVVDACLGRAYEVGRTVGGFATPLSVSAKRLSYRAHVRNHDPEQYVAELPVADKWSDIIFED